MKQSIALLSKVFSTICLAAMLLCFAAAAWADEADSSDDAARQAEGVASQTAADDTDVDYGEPIESGLVVVAGKPVDAPFRVGSAGREVFINGLRVAAIPRDKSATRKKKVDALTEKTQKAVQNLVAAIERQLYRDRALLVFDERTRLFTKTDSAFELLQALDEADSPSKRMKILLTRYYDKSTKARGEQGITTTQWRQALAAFEPSEELRRFLRDNSEFADGDFDGFVEEGAQAGAEPRPLPRTWRMQKTYLLTVFGMVLVVVSAGTLLSHRPEINGEWSKIVEGASQIRLIRDCVVLIVVLSTFDLACTLWSSTGEGTFSELNPLAHAWIPKPTVLIAFKVLATAAGVGILLWLRKYTGAQLASWWLCLLLTVLTVRWIAVQSLLLV